MKEIQGTSSSSSVADPALVPNIFASMKITDKLYVGLGLSVPGHQRLVIQMIGLEKILRFLLLFKVES